MTVTVSSASTSYDLTTLDTVKNELGLSSTASDIALSLMIQQASDFISRYTGRTFARETVVETLPANGEPNLVLSRTPVVSVAGISYAGSTISSTTFSVDDADAGILFNKVGWKDTTIYNQNINLHPSRFGRRDYAVTYTAGYVLPGSTSARTLPYDIERACIDMVKTSYLQRQDDPSVKARKVGDASETRFGGGGGDANLSMSPTTMAVLKQYVRLD